MKRGIIIILVIIGLASIIVPSCQKEISPEPRVQDSTFIATGSLKDLDGNCFPNTVTGSYYYGVTPGPDTAFLTIQVNVTNAGSYTISTDIQNGFQFVASGVFETTGINSVQLKPVGTPIDQGVTDFLVSFDTSFCFVSVNVWDSAGYMGIEVPVIDTWKFTHTGFGSYGGNIGRATFSTVTINQLFLVGAVPTGDSIVQINIAFPNPEISPGTYTTTNATNFFIFSSSTSSTLYKSDASTGTNVISFEIKSYDAINKIVTCSFSGKAQDIFGNTIPVSKGEFIAKVE